MRDCEYSLLSNLYYVAAKIFETAGVSDIEGIQVTTYIYSTYVRYAEED